MQIYFFLIAALLYAACAVLPSSRARLIAGLTGVAWLAHAATLWEEIGKVAETFPGAEPAVEFGFDALALVYPTLIWDEALRLTKAEGSGKE